MTPNAPNKSAARRRIMNATGRANQRSRPILSKTGAFVLTTAAVWTAVASVSACATTEDPEMAKIVAPASTVTASEKLRDVVERTFDRYLELHPLEATYIGDHRFDDRLGNPSSPLYATQMKALHEDALREASSISPAALDDTDRIILEIFLHERTLALEGMRFPTQQLPINQMGSLATSLAELGSGEGAQPFNTVADHDRWLARAREFPTWAFDAIRQMQAGVAANVTQPHLAMAKVVAQLDALIVDGVDNVDNIDRSLFFTPIKNASAISDEERARLEPAYRALIVDDLNPAFTRLRDYIRDSYLPACRNSFGWSALPDGDAWYAHHVARNTTTTLTPDEIFVMGEAEVKRIVNEMKQVKETVGFKGDMAAFFAHLRDDPKYMFSSSDELFNAYVDLKKRIDLALPKLFSDFPKADYEVRPIEAFRAASAPGAEYRAPSEDGSRPGIFYVNTFNLAAQPRYGIETLSLHEAAPGHHFQIAIQQELSHLPRFRRFADYNAYAEGWALYAESLGQELGLFQDPMMWYGRLNDEQLRAMRLVVDTGLHHKGWTRDQAVAFMLENSSLARSDVEAEVERYMVWPGQALGYKVGEFRIRAMRTRAEAALGDAFDVRAFHSVILRDGAMPLAVLDGKVDRFIEGKRSAP